MRKKQAIQAIVYFSSKKSQEFLQEKVAKFYMEQVEIQLEKYELTTQQKKEVLLALAEYHRNNQLPKEWEVAA